MCLQLLSCYKCCTLSLQVALFGTSMTYIYIFSSDLLANRMPSVYRCKKLLTNLEKNGRMVNGKKANA
ncbi:hypothetical protein XELAEV_18043949mg [Xenopus laevis]|uniref:Uncharacterized protein n=1 Tax=Xenopus laevis TaxID=8355 RepID=A0A974BXX8_XENLA|nr:hypothetical protein XELAEV_18043949mg [Xenopus laevis]